MTAAAPPPRPLPLGFVVRLNRASRVLDGGRTIVGGAPTRALRLTDRAVGLIVDGELVVRDAAGAALADRLLELGIADPVLDRLPAPEGAAEVTVVVPVRDRPGELARLLASVGALRLPAGGAPRILVVDDASERPERIRAVAAEHGAECVALRANVGPGGARNTGIARVSTPYLLLVDSDIVLPPNAVTAMLPHFADARVAMVAPRIGGLATPGSDTWIERYERARSSLDLGTRAAAVRPRSPVSWASTACVLVRTEALRDPRIGGFDAELRVGEDVDLTWRLVDAGWRVRYEPTVLVAHEHRARLGDWFVRKAVYGTGAAPLAARHPEHIVPAVLSPWSVGVVAALLAQRWWSVPLAAGVSAWTARRIAARLPSTAHPLRLAAWLTGNGVAASLAQASALLLRHWWPAALVACLVSRRMRRAVLVAAVADVAIEWRRNDARLDPVRFGIARRLDDLAYGAGVWWSAWRARSWAALRPDFKPPR